jgi:hypothetical protein
VFSAVARAGVIGFFFIGEGDSKGGFITGPELKAVSPDISACMSKYDLFGGFTSYSKYSPSAPASKAARGPVLSRSETLYLKKGAVKDSWTELCEPRLSLVYPTRTYAGRMKNDIKKFLLLLQEEKKKQGDYCLPKVSAPSR